TLYRLQVLVRLLCLRHSAATFFWAFGSRPSFAHSISRIPLPYDDLDLHEVDSSNHQPPPNKRLKLTGGDRLKGSGVLCSWRGRDFVPHPCAGGGVARGLSAIR